MGKGGCLMAHELAKIKKINCKNKYTHTETQVMK